MVILVRGRSGSGSSCGRARSRLPCSANIVRIADDGLVLPAFGQDGRRSDRPRLGRLADDGDGPGPGLCRVEGLSWLVIVEAPRQPSGRPAATARAGSARRCPAPIRRRCHSPPGPRRPVKIAYLNPGGSIGGARCACSTSWRRSATRGRVGPAVLIGDDGPLRPASRRWASPAGSCRCPAGVARLGDAGPSGRARGWRLASRLGPAAARGGLPSPACRVGSATSAARPDPDQRHEDARPRRPGRRPGACRSSGTCTTTSGRGPSMARLLRLTARAGRGVAAWPSRDRSPRTPGGAWARVPGRGRSTTPSDLDRFRPGPGDGAALDAASGLPRPRRGRSAWAWSRPSPPGRGMTSSSKPRRAGIRPDRAGPVLHRRRADLPDGGVGVRRSRAAPWPTAGPGRSGRVRRASIRPGRGDPGLDVVVHASTRPEPFGRVIVEAMACGRAVIAMREGGAAELFRDGDDGARAARPGDPDALASAMARLVNDPASATGSGAAGRRSAGPDSTVEARRRLDYRCTIA